MTQARFLLVAAGMLAAACNNFLTVDNPGVIAIDELDPVRDAPTLSLSARENFFNAAGRHAVFTSFLTWESWPADTPPEFTQFGVRAVIATNANMNGIVWAPLSIALVSNDKVVTVLRGTPGENASINVARSSLYGGYTLVLIAEAFCQVVINGGPPLTPVQAMDSAIARFTRAIDVAKAVVGVDAAEASNLVNAGYVGRARAQLQAGRKPQAAADAALVAPGFVLNQLYADNPSARAALANFQFQLTNDRRTIVVPPAWRIGDPRIPVISPPATGNPNAQDAVTPFFRQGKFTAYNAPQRLASRLEADYIGAEAGGAAPSLALIAARRAANGQPAYAGATDAGSVLAELMDQRTREFYLEGKRLGDFRRNGNAVPAVPAPGTPYFRPGASPVGNQTCLPLPLVETANNPNFPQP